MKGELPIARPTSGYAQLEELPEIPAWRGGNSTTPAATPTSPAAPLHLYGSAPAPAASAPAPSPDGGPPPSLALQSSLENESTQKKIKQLELKLLRRRDLYTFAGDHYQFLYRMLTIPTIILTASTGLVSAAWSEAPCSCGESGEPESDGESLSRTVAVSGLSAIATVLVSVNSLLKYESTHIAFFKAAQQCDTLSTKIGFLSSYNIITKDDVAIQDTMSEVEKDLIEISSYVPPVPSWLVNNFRSAALKAGMKHVETSAAPALKRKETKANFNLNA